MSNHIFNISKNESIGIQNELVPLARQVALFDMMIVCFKKQKGWVGGTVAFYSLGLVSLHDAQTEFRHQSFNEAGFEPQETSQICAVLLILGGTHTHAHTSSAQPYLHRH